jgi:hypothetical protein
MKQGTHDNPPQFTFGQMRNNPLQPVLNSIAMNMPTRIGPAFQPAADGYAHNYRCQALISVLAWVLGEMGGGFAAMRGRVLAMLSTSCAPWARSYFPPGSAAKRLKSLGNLSDTMVMGARQFVAAGSVGEPGILAHRNVINPRRLNPFLPKRRE